MPEYLFIGGAADGKRLNVQADAQFWRVPILDKWDDDKPFPVEEYRRMSFRSEDIWIDIFAAKEISHGLAFRMLVEKYPRPALTEGP